MSVWLRLCQQNLGRETDTWDAPRHHCLHFRTAKAGLSELGLEEVVHELWNSCSHTLRLHVAQSKPRHACNQGAGNKLWEENWRLHFYHRSSETTALSIPCEMRDTIPLFQVEFWMLAAGNCFSLASQVASVASVQNAACYLSLLKITLNIIAKWFS